MVALEHGRCCSDGLQLQWEPEEQMLSKFRGAEVQMGFFQSFALSCGHPEQQL